MGYRVLVSRSAEKDLSKIDRGAARRVLDFIENLDGTNDPRAQGKALTGPLRGFWLYRVGDYRVVCEIRDGELVVVALSAGHRREVYRRR